MSQKEPQKVIFDFLSVKKSPNKEISGEFGSLIYGCGTNTNFLFAKIDGANDVVILSWTEVKNFIAIIYDQ
jgi:hypothetical protein